MPVSDEEAYMFAERYAHFSNVHTIYRDSRRVPCVAAPTWAEALPRQDGIPRQQVQVARAEGPRLLLAALGHRAVWEAMLGFKSLGAALSLQEGP